MGRVHCLVTRLMNNNTFTQMIETENKTHSNWMSTRNLRWKIIGILWYWSRIQQTLHAVRRLLFPYIVVHFFPIFPKVVLDMGTCARWSTTNNTASFMKQSVEYGEFYLSEFGIFQNHSSPIPSELALESNLISRGQRVRLHNRHKVVLRLVMYHFFELRQVLHRNLSS